MDLLRSSWVMQIYSLQVKPMKDFFISLEIDSSLISLARPGPETATGPLTPLAAPQLLRKILAPVRVASHMFNHHQPVVYLMQGLKELSRTIMA